MNAPTPRLHFVALVSVNFDVDLLPYFLPHYSELGCDNYCLFLHEGKNTDANLWAEKAAKEFDWKVRFIPREASYQNGELRRALINKFRQAAKPHDFIITADGDEFQKWDKHPREVMGEGADVVIGGRFDKFNEKLLPVDHGEDLDATYPLMNENLSSVIYPKRIRQREKIVMARVGLPVDYRKCLSMQTVKGVNPQVTGEVPILHYKWRNNIFHRISQRPDYAPDEVQAIKNFFEVQS